MKPFDTTIWCGYGTEPIDGVEDPHLTIAFFGDNQEEIGTGRSLVGTGHSMGFGLENALKHIIMGHNQWYPNEFDVHAYGFDTFGGPESFLGKYSVVLRTFFPDVLTEGISQLRHEFRLHGFKYSTMFPFAPHITLGQAENEQEVADLMHKHEDLVGENITVQNSFLHFLGERTTWYLKPTEK